MSQATEPASISSAGTRPTWVRWQIVALLVAYSSMTWFNRVCMVVAGDEHIMPGYEISPTNMGIVYSAFLLTYTLFMTPGGWLIDRVGPWAALVVMGFGSAVFGALTSLAGVMVAAGTLLATLLVVRALMGVFTAPVYPASSRIVSHWIPWRRRAWANGLVQGAAAVGMAAAFPVFGALIDWCGWPKAFLITGGCTAVLALFWTVYATDYPSQHRFANEAERRRIDAGLVAGPGDDVAEPPSRWWLLLRNRSLMLLTLTYAAVGYIEYMFFFWMHYYFENVLKLTKAESRVYATVLFVAMAIGMPLGGWLSDRLQAAYGYRWGRAAVPMAGMVAGAAMLGLGLAAQDKTWIVIWLSLSLGAVGACEAPIWTTAVDLGGR